MRWTLFLYTCNQNAHFSLTAYLTNFPLLISLSEAQLVREAAAGNWVTFEKRESEADDAEWALYTLRLTHAPASSKKKDLDLRAPANAPGTGDPMTGMFLKTSSIMLNGFSRCLCSPAEKEGVPMPNHWDHFYISPNWLRHSENCLSIVAECFDS